MERLLQDIRQAARGLMRHRTASLAALLTLALGLGVNTALFSVVDGVLLKPLPYPDSEQLVRVSEHHAGATSPLQSARLSNLTQDAWDSRATLEGLGAYGSRNYLWHTADGTTRIEGGTLSPVVFSLLRATPFAGRFFLPDEERQGADAVVVLSHRLWMQRFGGRESAVGERMRLDDREHLIVGIAREGFAFPDGDALLWTPQTRLASSGDANRSVRVFEAIGRLRPGIAPERAAAEGTAAARTVERPMVADMLFGKGGPVEVRVTRMLDDATAEVRPALAALSVGVMLVLIVACANVANLLLASSTARRRELAVRAALGASRGRLLRLMLIEASMLAAGGIALGLLIASFLVDALPHVAPESFPRLDNVGIDARAGVAGILAAIVAALFSGVLPAWRGSRADLALAMKDDDGRSAGLASARLRAMLLVGEAALAIVLVVGAGLLVRSVSRLAEVDSGYDPANVLTARIYLTGASATAERRSALTEAVLRRVRALPGVTAAGAGNMAPFGESVFIAGTRLEATDANGQPIVAQFGQNVITPGFAEALGLRVIAGRTFVPTDTPSSPPILVSETFMRRYVNDGRPVVGRPMRLRGDNGAPPTVIAGVVKDVKPFGPRTDARADVYFLEGPANPITRELNLLVRTSGDPMALVPALRDIVRAEDRHAALDEVGTLSDRLATSFAQPRFFATVLGIFAALALVLAAIGLYGVLSYGVTLRRRELGVRAALGATRRDLLSLVVRQGLAATSAGLAVGLVLAFAAARAMRTLLFGIEPTDLPSFAAGAGILLVVALAASLIPARRAATSDPLEALRHE